MGLARCPESGQRLWTEGSAWILPFGTHSDSRVETHDSWCYRRAPLRLEVFLREGPRLACTLCAGAFLRRFTLLVGLRRILGFFATCRGFDALARARLDTGLALERERRGLERLLGFLGFLAAGFRELGRGAFLPRGAGLEGFDLVCEFGEMTSASSSTAIMAGTASVSREGSFQPWASRTAIIEERISFQVLGSCMVALGNMHPSQQMCRKASVGSPASSRSQNPA